MTAKDSGAFTILGDNFEVGAASRLFRADGFDELADDILERSPWELTDHATLSRQAEVTSAEVELLVASYGRAIIGEIDVSPSDLNIIRPFLPGDIVSLR